MDVEFTGFGGSPVVMVWVDIVGVVVWVDIVGALVVLPRDKKKV